MGIEKPLAVERGHLGPSPDRPCRVGADERVAALIRVADGGVMIAGETVAAPPGTGSDLLVARLRGELARRMRERRPNADETTWTRLRDLAASMASGRDVLDDDLQRTLLRTVDGL